MSDADTAAEIERHNSLCWERFREYWQKQGVEIDLVPDLMKGVVIAFGPGGLPAGYKGQDAIPVGRRGA